MTNKIKRKFMKEECFRLVELPFSMVKDLHKYTMYNGDSVKSYLCKIDKEIDEVLCLIKGKIIYDMYDKESCNFTINVKEIYYTYEAWGRYKKSFYQADFYKSLEDMKYDTQYSDNTASPRLDVFDKRYAVGTLEVSDKDGSIINTRYVWVMFQKDFLAKGYNTININYSEFNNLYFTLQPTEREDKIEVECTEQEVGDSNTKFPLLTENRTKKERLFDLEVAVSKLQEENGRLRKDILQRNIRIESLEYKLKDLEKFAYELSLKVLNKPNIQEK